MRDDQIQHFILTKYEILWKMLLIMEGKTNIRIEFIVSLIDSIVLVKSYINPFIDIKFIPWQMFTVMNETRPQDIGEEFEGKKTK